MEPEGTAVPPGEVKVARILDQLRVASESERREILESISPLLSSVGERGKYKQYLETSADLEVVFDCVNASSSDVIATVVNVVHNLLDFLDPSVILAKYSRSLKRCLDHPEPQVRRSVFHFLKKHPEWKDAEAGVELLLGNPDLIQTIVKSIIDEDLGVSTDAKATVYALVKSHPAFGSEQLFGSGHYGPLLLDMSKVNKETLRMRLYDFVVLIAKVSPEYTLRCLDLLKALCKELDSSDDFLLQLNVLEVLWELAEVNHGYQFLRDQGVLKHLDNQMGQVSASPYASMLMPGFVKFFGRIAHHNPVDFSENFPNFTSTLFQLLDSGAEADDLQTLALETVGFIASTPAGKRQLDQFNDVIDILTKTLQRGSAKQKIHALSTIANILKGEPEDLTEKFYTKLDGKSRGPTTMELVFDVMRQPFTDLSEAAYSVLFSLAGHPWGLQKIVSQPGFVEYLLDRSTLTSKDAKDMRYNLMLVIVQQNPEAPSIVQPNNWRKMQLYVKEGPYYVEALVQVALDEGS